MSRGRKGGGMGSLYESPQLLEEEEVAYISSGEEQAPEMPNRPAELKLPVGSSKSGVTAFNPAVQKGNSNTPTSSRAVPAARERVVPEEALRMRMMPLRDRRKFRYDTTNASRAAPVSYSVTKADRLDAYQAGALLHRLHKALDMLHQSDEHLLAFDKALFFEHTLNGASVHQPNRGNICVGRQVYPIPTIQAILGEDIRRFFRAYADDVANVNREVIDNFTPGDPEAVEMYGQLMQVAFERGMEKFPYLAHDTADACTFLTIEERNALAASKRFVLSQTNTSREL